MTTSPKTPTQWLTIALRVCFVCYTGVLLTATHWPGLAVQSSFSRMDLVIHAGAFGCWTMLLGMTGWIRSLCCVRQRALRVALCGIVFGIIDETTQPLFSRVFDWLDVAADTAGAILASCVLMVFWNRQCQHKHMDKCTIIDESLAPQSPDARS